MLTALSSETVTIFIGTDGSKNIDNTVRWLLGEESSLRASAGGRDMFNPSCTGYPDRVLSENYWCGSGDNHGSHINATVVDHAYALLTDGGSFNGQNIEGIGLNKAMKIFFRALDVYGTPTMLFPQYADSLEQACQDLIGEKVRDLKSGKKVKKQRFTSGDCEQVSKTIASVEFREPPACAEVKTVFEDTSESVLCPIPGEKAEFVFTDELNGEWENPNPDWSSSQLIVDPALFTVELADFTKSREWFISQENTDNFTYRSISPFAENTALGLDANEAGVMHLDSPVIQLPEGSYEPLMSFRHSINLETDLFIDPFGDGDNVSFDGALLQISVNGGPFQRIEASAFDRNGYNAFIFPAEYGNNNPLAGNFPDFHPIFAGAPLGIAGYNPAAFFSSDLHLGDYAQPGDTIQLRFDLSTDQVTSAYNAELLGREQEDWIIDSMDVYRCVVDDHNGKGPGKGHGKGKGKGRGK